MLLIEDMKGGVCDGGERLLEQERRGIPDAALMNRHSRNDLGTLHLCMQPAGD